MNVESTILFFKHAIMTLFFFAKISANMSFSSNYSGEAWEYKSGNAEGIQKSVSLSNWQIAFENISINEKDGLLNKS